MTGWVLAVWGLQVGVFAVLGVLGLRALRAARRRPVLGEAPSVTVVAAVYGWESWKEACLESLLTQQYPGRLEVVLSFQDPADPALRAVRELGWADDHDAVLAAGLGDGEGRARLVVNPVPAGWTAAASNYAHGAEAGTGEVIVFACDDTLAGPDAVSALVARLGPGTRIVSAIPVVVEARSAAARVSAAFYNASAVFGWAPGVVLGAAAAWGGLMAVRRADLEAAGGVGVLRGRIAEDLALAGAVAGRGQAGLGPVVRSPVGAASWGTVWQRFVRLAVMAVHQSPFGRRVTLPALGLQYAYLALPVAAGLWGSGPLWLLFGLLAATRWTFVALASVPAPVGVLAAAPVADALHAAALVRAAVSPEFRWGEARYRVVAGGLERR